MFLLPFQLLFETRFAPQTVIARNAWLARQRFVALVAFVTPAVPVTFSNGDLAAKPGCRVDGFSAHLALVRKVDPVARKAVPVKPSSIEKKN